MTAAGNEDGMTYWSWWAWYDGVEHSGVLWAKGLRAADWDRLLPWIRDQVGQTYPHLSGREPEDWRVEEVTAEEYRKREATALAGQVYGPSWPRPPYVTVALLVLAGLMLGLGVLPGMDAARQVGIGLLIVGVSAAGWRLCIWMQLRSGESSA